MSKRGRKSAAELETRPTADNVEALAPPPDALDANAAALWRQIVQQRPGGFFSAGDLPLLREYVYTVATLLPRIQREVEKGYDSAVLADRDKLVRQAASLARSLRICVSSRTRPDTAGMRDSVRQYEPPWV